jgi:hypothetical protein
MSDAIPPPSAKPHRSASRLGWLVAGLVLIYLVVAYVLLPAIWTRYARRHPALDDVPDITNPS